MRTFACLSTLVAAFWCLPTHGIEVIHDLELTNGLNWGDLGPLEYCKDGSYAKVMEAKYESYSLLEADETALNALRLSCVTKEEAHTGYIMSTEGTKGKWQGERSCNTGYLTSLRARVLEPQGTFGDDVAIQNVQMECNYGTTILTAVEDSRIDLGDWGEWASCPKESAVCGIRVYYDSVKLTSDDAATSNILMFCCALNTTVTTTAP